MKKKISIIIPVCNEKNNIGILVKSLQKELCVLPFDYTITYIDDGSTDGTLQAIREEAVAHQNIFFISLSRNFGHQNALKAGLDASNGDCVITMDGDMQHPAKIIPELIRLWESGYDIVYTVRKDQVEIPMMKRKTSRLFYKLLNGLSTIELDSGSADFRLLDKRVVDILRNFTEEDLFWRGIVKWLGFKQIGVEYSPEERSSGESKYTYLKMIQFALKGITSFSTKPLTISIYLGFCCAILSVLYLPYVLISLYFGRAVSGWSSVIITIVFFGGLQLMILGIIGMYLGKLFMQSKQRPHYIIKETNLQ
jgi:glycosyltransferase involved in cell wall biosynthesis